MSAENNKRTAHRIFAALNDRDLGGVTSYFDPGACFYGWGPQALDVHGYTTTMSELLEAFPDSQFPIQDVIAEGDRVVTRWSMAGTHGGEVFGIPPTHRRVQIGGTAIDRLRDGRVAEIWEVFDQLTLMQQLGVVPTPEK